MRRKYVFEKDLETLASLANRLTKWKRKPKVRQALVELKLDKQVNDMIMGLVELQVALTRTPVPVDTPSQTVENKEVTEA